MVDMDPSQVPEPHYDGTCPHSLGLYIHVPFCWVRCHFCAFYTERYREALAQSYVAALKQEMDLYVRRFREWGDGPLKLSTVYFGGGTPTTLSVSQLSDIVASLSVNFVRSTHTEMTIEAHPHTATQVLLEPLRMAGFNRLSLGGQSLQEKELVRLGGGLHPSHISQAVGNARAAGFNNINLDLMYGLPGQTLESWTRTVRDVLLLEPEHISCYALTIEEGTRFEREARQGTLEECGAEVQIRMAECARTILRKAGYRQYEIANFARPGFECRHNIGYWEGRVYLGLGPSAQSFIGSTRFGNVDDLEQYERACRREEFPLAGSECLDAGQVLRERAIFGLRMTKGVPLEIVQRAFAGSREEHTVWDLVNAGLLERTQNRLRLSNRGQHLADSVAVALW